jgi:hypothetical protein
MGAFASAGFVVLPPIHSYTTVMQATVSIGVMVGILAWTSSTVIKVLTRIHTRIERLWWKIYHRYAFLLDPIIETVYLIKEKIQMD